MRLVDAILRQGHLSEAAIVEALITGERPSHLDTCEVCGLRAHTLSRGLDAARTAAADVADAVFTAERLAAQQAQILRRLEQLDEPAKVLAFPAVPAASVRPASAHRVAPAWVGVAAAAGLVIGAIGGHGTARLRSPQPAPPAAPPAAAVQPPSPADVETMSAPATALLDMEDLESFVPEPLGAINALTPRTMLVSLNVSAR